MEGLEYQLLLVIGHKSLQFESIGLLDPAVVDEDGPGLESQHQVPVLTHTEK